MYSPCLLADMPGPAVRCEPVRLATASTVNDAYDRAGLIAGVAKHFHCGRLIKTDVGAPQKHKIVMCQSAP